MEQYVVLRDPPPKRRLHCDGSQECHLPEAAVMIAFAIHLLDCGAAKVELHPDGEHGKKYDIRKCLESRGFSFMSGHGTTSYAGIYHRLQQEVIITLKSGLGDVVAQVGEQLIVAECKGGIMNTRHPGQTSKLRRGLCEAVGLLLSRPLDGERQVAVVPATNFTKRFARQFRRRAFAAGIEVALVDERGAVAFVDNCPPSSAGHSPQ